jgi:hypothetical protein
VDGAGPKNVQAPFKPPAPPLERRILLNLVFTPPEEKGEREWRTPQETEREESYDLLRSVEFCLHGSLVFLQ